MSHYSSSNWPSRFLLSTGVTADWTNARNGRRICSQCLTIRHSSAWKNEWICSHFWQSSNSGELRFPFQSTATRNRIENSTLLFVLQKIRQPQHTRAPIFSLHRQMVVANQKYRDKRSNPETSLTTRVDPILLPTIWSNQHSLDQISLRKTTAKNKHIGDPKKGREQKLKAAVRMKWVDGSITHHHDRTVDRIPSDATAETPWCCCYWKSTKSILEASAKPNPNPNQWGTVSEP
jgi:hypothetical protein